MSFDVEIRDAVQVHAAWKQRLNTAIRTGQSDLSVAVVCRDDQCRLGRWLYSLDEPMQASHRWQCVRRKHADFHRHAARVLELALSGDTSAARAATSYSSGFAQTSARLMADLIEWQKETVSLGAV